MCYNIETAKKNLEIISKKEIKVNSKVMLLQDLYDIPMGTVCTIVGIDEENGVLFAEINVDMTTIIQPWKCKFITVG